MAVRIRMKKMGRAHRHFFRICAIDKKSPRDGRVLEELGTYDPMLTDIDARAVLKKDRVAHWLSVGAQPSEKCAVLIKKYGAEGTHLDKQAAALEKLAMPTEIPDAGEPASLPKSDEPEEAKTEAAPEGDAPAAESAEAPADSPEKKPQEEKKPEEDKKPEETTADATPEEKAEEKPTEEEVKSE